MIAKPLSSITAADLQQLVTDGAAEGRSIEFKRDQPGPKESDKKEFLADVSSFANAGGDVEFSTAIGLSPFHSRAASVLPGETECTMESAAAVIQALERAPVIVAPLVREVPPSVLKRRPAPKKWSAHEHACHLAVVHGLFFDRLEQILTSPAPVITPYDPGQSDPDDRLLRMDLEDSLQQYVDDRQRLTARLRTLSESDWQRTAEHGEYSHYSVFVMFRHLALHDFFHAYRIEELLLNKAWARERETVASGPAGA